MEQKKRLGVLSGDMGSCTGIFSEAYEYSINFELPITFVISDNNKSVCTETRSVWGTKNLIYQPIGLEDDKGKILKGVNLLWFKYQSKYPHAGRTV